MSFPEITKTIKFSDPPWLNLTVKRASNRKRKYYRKNGNTETWKRICSRTEDAVKDAKIGFITKVKENVRSANNWSAFFKALPCLNSKTAPKP